MSAVATWLARHAWYWMLYFIRRPWIKRWQRHWLREVPGKPYKQFPKAFRRQNRFARRFGLHLLTFTFNLFLVSVFVTFAYQAATYMLESGLFQPPDRVTAAHYHSR